MEKKAPPSPPAPCLPIRGLTAKNLAIPGPRKKKKNLPKRADNITKDRRRFLYRVGPHNNPPQVEIEMSPFSRGENRGPEPASSRSTDIQPARGVEPGFQPTDWLLEPMLLTSTPGGKHGPQATGGQEDARRPQEAKTPEQAGWMNCTGQEGTTSSKGSRQGTSGEPLLSDKWQTPGPAIPLPEVYPTAGPSGGKR